MLLLNNPGTAAKNGSTANREDGRCHHNMPQGCTTMNEVTLLSLKMVWARMAGKEMLG